MTERLPSIAALSAFSAAARHGNFSRAARDLRTSQPAVSRHVADLELRLGVTLFKRKGNAVCLTSQGAALHEAVENGLAAIRAGVTVARQSAQQLTIACTHEVSHLFVMPRFQKLQASTGPGTEVRIVTCE